MERFNHQLFRLTNPHFRWCSAVASAAAKKFVCDYGKGEEHDECDDDDAYDNSQADHGERLELVVCRSVEVLEVGG